MDTVAYVMEHLARFRAGDEDAAFHGLIHRELGLLAPLADAFSVEQDPAVKAFIVNALWEQRDFKAIPVLSEALADRDSRVWKESLNGLVALACDESLEVLRRALTRPVSDGDGESGFRSWVREAIEQATSALQNPQ